MSIPEIAFIGVFCYIGVGVTCWWLHGAFHIYDEKQDEDPILWIVWVITWPILVIAAAVNRTRYIKYRIKVSLKKARR